MDSAWERRRWREDYVSRFLAEADIGLDKVGEATRVHLDAWARQMHVIENQPSANWDSAILQLCKAVESELALTLGRVKGLEFLASKDALGTKAKRLNSYKADVSIEQRLRAKGLRPGFVGKKLPRLLKDLADIRSDTDSAHGGIEISSASEDDARRTRGLAAKIIRGITFSR